MDTGERDESGQRCEVEAGQSAAKDTMVRALV